MEIKKITALFLVLALFSCRGFADRAHEIAKMAPVFMRANAKNEQNLKEYAKSPISKRIPPPAVPDDLYLNFLKNQTTLPDFEPEKFLTEKDFVTLNAAAPAGITARNHAEFAGLFSGLGEGNICGLIGYVYYASSQEFCDAGCGSCEDDSANRKFFTIGIGFDEALAKELRDGRVIPQAELAGKSVAVEMTAQFYTASNPNWSPELMSAEIGRPVKVIGQLIFDNAGHPAAVSASTATAASASAVFSLWKIRPVTRFYIGQGDKLSPPASAGWKTIEEIVKE